MEPTPFPMVLVYAFPAPVMSGYAEHHLHPRGVSLALGASTKELKMRGFAKVCVVVAVAGVVLVPAPVRADGYVTPWFGVTGVDSNDDGQLSVGVVTGYM